MRVSRLVGPWCPGWLWCRVLGLTRTLQPSRRRLLNRIRKKLSPKKLFHTERKPHWRGSERSSVGLGSGLHSAGSCRVFSSNRLVKDYNSEPKNHLMLEVSSCIISGESPYNSFPHSLPSTMKRHTFQPQTLTPEPS